jgi:hypothetical protein
MQSEFIIFSSDLVRETLWEKLALGGLDPSLGQWLPQKLPAKSEGICDTRERQLEPNPTD